MRSFEDVFGFGSQMEATAPGRVNLLGEHTDYNEGFVLPTAIPQTTRVAIARSRDERFRFYSANVGEYVEFADGSAAPAGYARYIHGCIEVVRGECAPIPPLAVYVQSDVPIGVGLSSSAALEVAVLRALRALFAFKLDDVTLALLAQQAEMRYAGVLCGVMDQMAASLADRTHMLFLDTRSGTRRLLPLPAGAELMVLNSGVPRSLATSSYNARRAACFEAAALLGVRALRDIDDPERTRLLPAPLDRRAHHVVTENQRVLEAAGGCDAERFGALMNASHASLRDEFEVSVPALDTLVEILQKQPAIFGARLTGAGFGGACVALAQLGRGDAVKRVVLAEYARHGYAGAVLV